MLDLLPEESLGATGPILAFPAYSQPEQQRLATMQKTDERMLEELAREVARDFSGRIVIGNDLTEIDV